MANSVLFLCTGNSARSVLAEALLNRLGEGRFRAYSAGSHPTGRVNPHAITLLKQLDFPIEQLRSKSWDEFAAASAPPLDFIITVCDNAAGEVCPIWPGRPSVAHWGVPDPASATGSDADVTAAFVTAFATLKARIERFIGLPLDKLSAPELKHELDLIGRLDASDPAQTSAAST